MSRALIEHEIILKYSSIWQDTIRNGDFTLTNTNRLVRYYDGCNGLKTGSTDKAGYCISTTAKRGNMQLIAVILGAPTKDERNAAARALLDYGFANYAVFERAEEFVEQAKVLNGVKDTMDLYRSPAYILVEKSKLSSVEEVYEIPKNFSSPIKEGEAIGRITYFIDGNQIGFSEICSKESIEKITISEIFIRILKRVICG